MIIQTKKLIPEIYAQSYDMSVFTGLLDLVYTARQLDVLRIKNAHLPQRCFDEDVASLASLFGLGITSNRDLIENYRLLVRQKGTRETVLALVQLAGGFGAQQLDAELRIIRQDFYSDTSSKSIVGTHVTLEVYLPLDSMDYELLDLLIRRLAPVGACVVVKDIKELQE